MTTGHWPKNRRVSQYSYNMGCRCDACRAVKAAKGATTYGVRIGQPTGPQVEMIELVEKTYAITGSIKRTMVVLGLSYETVYQALSRQRNALNSEAS